MIRFEKRDIPDGDRARLAEFLVHPGRLIVEKMVKGEIAMFQAQASNVFLQDAFNSLIEESVPRGTVTDLRKAARYQIFLDVLKEITPATQMGGTIQIE